MLEKTVGKFTITVADPYPYWITLKYGDKEINGIHNDDLEDLIYGLQKAKEHIDKHELTFS